MNESRPYQRSPFWALAIVLGLIVVVPLLLCGGVLTWFFGRYSAASKELTVRTESLRAEDVPVDYDSVADLHRRLTSDERTDRWVELTAVVEGRDFDVASVGLPHLGAGPEIPPPDQPWTDEQTVKDFLATHDELLKSIHELAEAELADGAKPIFRPIEMEGLGTLLPDTQATRALSRLMMLEWEVALRDNDSKRALECIRACQGLEASLLGEPMVVSQLVRFNVANRRNEMLRRSIEHDLLQPQQLRAIRRDIPSIDDELASFSLAVQGERGLSLPVFSDPAEAAALLEIEEAENSPLLGKLRSRDAIFYLDQIGAFEDAPTELAEFREHGQKWGENLSAKVDSSSAAEKTDYIVSYLLLPALQTVSAAYSNAIEIDNLARLAIDVRLYRVADGSLPQTMDELIKKGDGTAAYETAGDEPFGYLKEDSGVTVWGIERLNSDVIPETPPNVQGDEEANRRWVWRVPKLASP